MDWDVVHFLTRCQYKKAEEAMSLEEKIDVIKKAIFEGMSLEILYLKPSNEKNVRIVRPIEVGEMEYKGKRYMGMRAFCSFRQEERVFRVDRILNLKVLKEQVVQM